MSHFSPLFQLDFARVRPSEGKPHCHYNRQYLSRACSIPRALRSALQQTVWWDSSNSLVAREIIDSELGPGKWVSPKVTQEANSSARVRALGGPG